MDIGCSEINFLCLFVPVILQAAFGRSNSPLIRPRHVTVSADSNNITVHWQAPSDSYGTIRQYIIDWSILPELSDRTSVNYVDGHVNTSLIPVGWDAGRVFRIRVRAVNQVGVGQYSIPRYIRPGCGNKIFVDGNTTASIHFPNRENAVIKSGVICSWKILTQEKYTLTFQFDSYKLPRNQSLCGNIFINIAGYGSLCNSSAGINKPLILDIINTTVILRTGSLTEEHGYISFNISSNPRLPGPPTRISIQTHRHGIAVAWQPPIENTFPITSYYIKYAILSLRKIYMVNVGPSMRQFFVNTDNFSGKLVQFNIVAVMGQKQGQISRPYFVKAAFVPTTKKPTIDISTIKINYTEKNKIVKTSTVGSNTSTAKPLERMTTTSSPIIIPTHAKTDTQNYTDIGSTSENRNVHTTYSSSELSSRKETTLVRPCMTSAIDNTNTQSELSESTDDKPNGTTANGELTTANIEISTTNIEISTTNIELTTTNIEPKPAKPETIPKQVDKPYIEHNTFTQEINTLSSKLTTTSLEEITTKPKVLTKPKFGTMRSDITTTSLPLFNVTTYALPDKKSSATKQSEPPRTTWSATAASYHSGALIDKNTTDTMKTTGLDKGQTTLSTIQKHNAREITRSVMTTVDAILIGVGTTCITLTLAAILICRERHKQHRMRIHSELTCNKIPAHVELHNILEQGKDNSNLKPGYCMKKGTNQQNNNSTKSCYVEKRGTIPTAWGSTRSRHNSFPLSHYNKINKQTNKVLKTFSFIEDQQALQNNLQRKQNRKRTNSF